MIEFYLYVWFVILNTISSIYDEHHQEHLIFTGVASSIWDLIEKYLFSFFNLEVPNAPNIDLHFAPGLQDVLEDDRSSPVDFSMSLPDPASNKA
jgi:hypothetical protein